MTKVLIVDSQGNYSQAIQQVLEDENFIESIERMDSAYQAMKRLRARENAIDILILSLQGAKGDPTGLYYAHLFRDQFPRVKLITYSSYKSGFFVKKMHDLKVQGFLFKNEPMHILQHTISEVLNGNSYFSLLAKETMSRYEGLKSDNSHIQLHPREQMMLRYLLLSYSQEEIARKMGKKLISIEIILKYLLNKFQVRSKQSLIQKAQHAGFLS